MPNYSPARPVVSARALQLWARSARKGRAAAPMLGPLTQWEERYWLKLQRVARAQLRVESRDWRISRTTAEVMRQRALVEGWEAGRDPTHDGRCPYKLPRLVAFWSRGWDVGREDYQRERLARLSDQEEQTR